MRTSLPFGSLSLVLVLFFLGCDSAPVSPVDAGNLDGSVMTDSGTRDSGRRDSGSVDAAGPDAGDDSFATALVTTVNATTAPTGVIDPASDRDYYRFDVMAGDWLLVATAANAMDDPMKVDTVITLYDGAMTQVAQNDDAQPRGNTDSEIIYHVPAAGTYYVMVQEFSDWHGDTPEAHPMDTYTLTIATLDPTRAGLVADPETGNDAASATPIELGMTGGGLIVGTFASATDVDVYSLSVTSPSLRLFQTTIMPSGTSGYGSTTPVGQAWVTDVTGTTILARITDSTMLNDVSPPLATGSYLLWVSHPAPALGANDFYVLKEFLGNENPPEAHEAENDVIATAETLTYAAPTGSTTVRAAYVLSSFPTAADVDHYAIDLMTGEHATAACGAMTSGSGVRGLHLSLVDATDTVVGTASVDETTAAGGAIVMDTAVPAPGTYYFKLTIASLDAMVTGTWARCGFRAVTPMP